VPNLIVAGDSIRNPEIRHEVPLAVPDPFLYLERDGRRVAILNSLEVGRARALGIEGLEVRALEEFGSDEMANRGLILEQINREVALLACRELGIESVVAPPTFPLEIADHLRSGEVEVRADRELFDARRRVKNEHELAGIRRAQAACEAAMDAARALLRSAVPNGGALKVGGEPLTSERLKAAPPASRSARTACRRRSATTWAPARSRPTSRSCSTCSRATVRAAATRT